MVYLIDDDAAVLDALGLYLETKGFIVQRFRDADAVAALDLDRQANQCIVSDVRMQGMSGLELMAVLKRRGITVPLILITGHGDIDMAVSAIKAGAHDFLEKPFDERRLVASIEEAVAAFRQRQSATHEADGLRARHDELSERQQQVMAMAAKGLTNKEIGATLGISPRTVEIYRARVMERMGARTLADLVRIALAISDKQ